MAMFPRPLRRPIPAPSVAGDEPPMLPVAPTREKVSAVGGAVAGGALGLVLGGPVGGFFGAVLGGALGRS